jgi:hypothetical protein
MFEREDVPRSAKLSHTTKHSGVHGFILSIPGDTGRNATTCGLTDHTKWYLREVLGYVTRGEEMQYCQII